MKECAAVRGETMGDRVNIRIKAGEQAASCGVYLHWGGEGALDTLRNAIPAMRKGDPDYSTARLIGVLHKQMKGNTGLGVVPFDFEDGDAGVVTYDCESGEVTCEKGYLKTPSKPFPLPPA